MLQLYSYIVMLLLKIRVVKTFFPLSAFPLFFAISGCFYAVSICKKAGGIDWRAGATAEIAAPEAPPPTGKFLPQRNRSGGKLVCVKPGLLLRMVAARAANTG